MIHGPVQAVDSSHFDWQPWEALLQKYVTPGAYDGIASNLVDYQALSREKSFFGIAKALKKYDPSSLRGDEKEAFYINAYNYFAARLIVTHWPVDSIRDIGNLFWPVWYHDAGNINGHDISLNEIEHEILIPMGDPRIHFAIVCASMSCPNLRREAYDGGRLNEQLAQQISELVNNPDKGVHISDGVLTVSALFDWFQEDFDAQGGVVKFLRQYRELPDTINAVEYMPYNWHVNAISKSDRK